MVRFGRLAVVAALAWTATALAWTATALAQFVAWTATEENERIEWTERRNLFLLCSSLSTNALALTTVYRYATRRWRGRGE
ncbi:hypothetical protein [Natronococcus sp. A-GB7]|uniref:hypothetical protein n=1 Tax=Natronococcus sp. A-GB7 TaxID=3037649 RepID=UPI00241CBEFE|nr:hypothetical protein [Natronococcus sp. A-GB7]MDG5818368.1 hypothetical protein [Natronococcus sp. A-GB7]